MQNTTAIPQKTALQLCQEIREENRSRWYTLDGLRCWWCATFSKGPERRCFASRPDYRGCGQVNARFDAIPTATVAEPVDGTVKVDVADEAEIGAEPPNVIYLPPAGFSPMQRRVTCLGCGRQFRLAPGQQEVEYCPTCDYRRRRGQLLQETGDDSADQQDD